MKLKSKNKVIDLNKKVFIVAEIGKNFIQTQKEQSVKKYLENAMRLVDAAQTAGADAVKFQTHTVEDEQLNIKILSPHFNGMDRYNWVKRNTLATPVKEFWVPLKKYCDQKGIIFFSTPMSRGAANLLDKLKVPLWKIGSGDILDFVMLDFISKTKKPVVISSGMSTLSELNKAVNFLKKRKVNLILLHAVSKYPCPPEDLNLLTIKFLKNKFKLPIGFSDHSLGHESAVVAVSLGARVIEKHFSLSRNSWGADHKVSMLPFEFKKMVSLIRKLENGEKINFSKYDKKALGKSNKFLLDDEAVFRPIFRKTLVASRNIIKGEILNSEMMYALRPQKHIKGLTSDRYEEVLGRKVRYNVKKLEPVSKRLLV